ncbi:MAG: hypothetical protein DI630_00695 [Gordonia sp. (in: high G+C Gram-positive bacteria)]|nr:MAG: hypothetical protein DI630_00695 [Gordonia sp. (in: high G+C Gram-positive bacteria)]
MPRSLLIGGAAAVVAIVVVVILVITVSGGGGDDDGNTGTGGVGPISSSPAETFDPNLNMASFIDRKNSKNEYVTPPQHITVTDSLDLKTEVEAIGYGPIEQSMPKIAKYADTDSSFPRQDTNIAADDNGKLRMFWQCEMMYKTPAGADCSHRYNMTLDISGPTPRVIDSAPTAVGDYDAAPGAVRLNAQRVSVSNPQELPDSILGTDKLTGAPTVFVLNAVQPRESASTVYFVVPDSLKLYVGTLESSR